MIIPLDIVSVFMFENFENVSVSKNGTHFHGRCALCGDSKKRASKKRFHLDYNNGDIRYNCFNCNRSGGFIKLYSLIKGCSLIEARKKFNKFDAEYLASVLKQTKKYENIKQQSIIKYYDDILYDCIDTSKIPAGIIETQYINALKKFISSRKIEDNLVYISVKGKYCGRVIIPIIQNNHVLYFQARTLTNEEPKYINPTAKKESIILNLNKFDRSKHIIITEGILDAWSIGNQGTSCLGASISNEFLSKVLSYSDVPPILALDNDARGIEETFNVLNNNQHSNKLLYFLMPENHKYIKDLSELKNSIDCVYDFVVSNSFSKFDTLVKLKFRGKL